MRRKFLKNTILLNNVFTCLLYNLLVIKSRYLYVSFDLPQNTFFVFVTKTIGLCFKIFELGNRFWEIFWALNNFNKIILFGFFCEFSLIGLGFRIKRIIDDVFRFWWGRSNFTYLFVPKNILIEYSYYDRMLYLFSYSVMVVTNFLAFFMLLCKVSRYRIHGIITPNKIVKLHAGKQK